jgi:hypothetical protein
MTQAARLEAFSHVVERVFFLPLDNVVWQALLDVWGASNSPCMIHVLLTVPLQSLQATYGGTYDAQPLSNAL